MARCRGCCPSTGCWSHGRWSQELTRRGWRRRCGPTPGCPLTWRRRRCGERRCFPRQPRTAFSSSFSTTRSSTIGRSMCVWPILAGPLDPVADKNFWTAELTGIPDGVRWPGVIGHAEAATSRGETRRFRLDVSVADAWRGIAREADATLFSALFAAFHAWVHRATGSEDTVIATPVAGRGVEGLEEAVGCFLNTLPIRVRWGGDPALARGPAGAAIRRVRDTFLTALDRGQLPFLGAGLSDAGGGNAPEWQRNPLLCRACRAGESVGPVPEVTGRRPRRAGGRVHGAVGGDGGGAAGNRHRRRRVSTARPGGAAGKTLDDARKRFAAGGSRPGAFS